MESDIWKDMASYPHLSDFEIKIFEMTKGNEDITEFRAWPQKP